MKDKLRDQMSAFLDDELPDEEAGLLLRRLQSDAELRGAAGRYLLIGQALRGERIPPAGLAERVAAALDGESTYSEAAAPGRPRWLRPVAGGAVAATVAVVALMGLQTNSELPGPEAVTADAAEEVVPAATRGGQADDGYAYTVPVDAALTVRPVSAVPARLTNYMISHGERAGTLMRSGMHSRIVTQPDGRWETSTVTSEDGRTGTAESAADDAVR